MKTEKPYVIGIDLGTTNCAVSYVDMAAFQKERSTPDTGRKQKYVKVFHIPQLTGHGELTKLPVLPSFLYIPGEYDISKEVLKHPWKKSEDFFAGSFARDHGSKIPSRLVSSAKSWLCNPGVDRTAKILPWGSSGVEKISPVSATREYLLHIRSAWNHSVKDEDLFLENQFVVITVPASFNEAARDLTMEAVKAAGFGTFVTLIEEPLAAFYSWLLEHENSWQDQVKPDDLILVCDVGGGTTDFSLISLKAAEGTPRFERIAVGDHLILGGDNIDLALAKKVESKFRPAAKLSSDKWKTLCHRCREAKEQILEKDAAAVRITIKGEGSALIAGTRSADLEKAEVVSILETLFFPDITPGAVRHAETEKQIADFGLPFETDSAVTRHIIDFLEKHRNDVRHHLEKDPVPDWILFNGGTLKPAMVQERIVAALRKWFQVSSDSVLRILENRSPELAVGIGAAYYGMVKQGVGVKVGSGSPRNYYLGIATDTGAGKKAVCLVERGLDEGSVIDLSGTQYDVRTNEPVSFDIYSSSYRSGDMAGDLVDIDESISFMAPLQTMIRFGKNAEKKAIPVTIVAEYTEMGSLVIYCRSGVSDHKWRLSFQLRDTQETPQTTEDQIYETHVVEQALEKIVQTFSCGNQQQDQSQELNGIVRQIEAIVGQSKANWPLSFLRAMADTLLDLESCRKTSANHEARWLNLVGFCMRPGFGDAFDENRAVKLWKIYLSGLQYDKQAMNRMEWWIFIRRFAAGLKAGQQRQFFQDVSGMLLKPKSCGVKMSPQEQVELWMAAGNMERLLVKDKAVLAKALLPQLKPGKSQKVLFWTLARLGARDLLYGSADRVVPPAEAFKWLTTVMKKPWTSKDPVENMVVQISRKSGDRTRDMAEEHQARVVQWLKQQKADPALIQKVTEKMDRVVADQHTQFGERLPAGLVLKT